MKYGIPASQGAGIFVFEPARSGKVGLGGWNRGAMAEQLILIRHGEVAEAYRGRYIGRTDIPLSARGRRQAAALAGPLSRFPGARFRTSPLARTRETAEIALGAGRSIDRDEDLREIDFGRWEAMSFAEIAAADPGTVEEWAAMDEGFAFPEGEAIAEFRGRIAAAARRIAADPASAVVAFTHGGVIRFLICHFLSLPDRCHLAFDIAPASLSVLRIDGGRGVLTGLNDRRHLEDL
jgi:broad specificity phosphatase PhoE